jgi:ribonuclease HI
MSTPINIYTDGGCSGNPGPGGWAYVIVADTFLGKKIKAEELGAELDTTNNRMELTAVIMALRAFKKMSHSSHQAKVFTDSQYVQKGITEWIIKWKRNSWRTSDKTPVKNQDLWKELDELNDELLINWEWLRGHSGHVYNERCDRMAQQAVAAIIPTFQRKTY